MLKREISKLGSYATLIGMMVGAGIFVAIGEAGRDAGPSTWLAYLALGPVTLLAALPYIIFHSTSIGSLPGGAYMGGSVAENTRRDEARQMPAMWRSGTDC